MFEQFRYRGKANLVFTTDEADEEDFSLGNNKEPLLAPARSTVEARTPPRDGCKTAGLTSIPETPLAAIGKMDRGHSYAEGHQPGLRSVMAEHVNSTDAQSLSSSPSSPDGAIGSSSSSQCSRQSRDCSNSVGQDARIEEEVPLATDSDLDKLRDMFPDQNTSSLKMALRRCDGVTEAIDYLLSKSASSPGL